MSGGGDCLNGSIDDCASEDGPSRPLSLSIPLALPLLLLVQLTPCSVLSHVGRVYDLKVRPLPPFPPHPAPVSPKLTLPSPRFARQILIWSLTEVPPERIKLLGLSSLKIPLEDSLTLAELKIKKGGKFVMIGTSSPLLLLRLRLSALLAE